MLLVIPSIEISDGRCARNVRRADGILSPQDPIEMAVLWRKENAKTLHLVDRDGTRNGLPVNIDTIRKMVATVDIPFEMVCPLKSFDEVQHGFDCGIYRIIVGPDLLDNSSEVTRVLSTFGPSKVSAGIGVDVSLSVALTLGMRAKELGFKRIVYGDMLLNNQAHHANLSSTARLLATQTSLRVTVSGGVSSLEELLMLQEEEPTGVDSVIIGQALYENKFACQGLWRLCEAGDFPFTARV